jgi:hypothetical protein
VDNLSPEVEDQRAVADEADLQVTCWTLDDVRLELLLGNGINYKCHGKQIDQQ